MNPARECNYPQAGQPGLISRREFLVGSVALGAMLVGAVGSGHCAEGPRWKVGLILPQEGQYASRAQSLAAGFDLFLKEKGADAGALQIIRKDPGSDDSKTLEAIADLVMKQEVHFLIGPPSPEGSEKLLHSLTEPKAVVFCTDPAVKLISGELCAEWAFRVCPNWYQAAWPIASWSLRKVGRKVFITGDDDLMGNSLADFFAFGFERAGGMFGDRVMAPTSGREHKALVEKIVASKPDFVFAAFRGARSAAFLKSLRESKPAAEIQVIGPETLVSYPHTLGLLGKRVAGVRTPTTMLDPESFAARIKKKNGAQVEDVCKAAEGYDLANIIFQATKANSPDAGASKLAAAIREMEIDGPRGKIRFDANNQAIFEFMVQEWTTDGKNFKQKIVEKLGPCPSLDFGCGRVGFPRGPDSEPKDELLGPPSDGEILWDEEGQ